MVLPSNYFPRQSVKAAKEETKAKGDKLNLTMCAVFIHTSALHSLTTQIIEVPHGLTFKIPKISIQPVSRN